MCFSKLDINLLLSYIFCYYTFFNSYDMVFVILGNFKPICTVLLK